MQKNDLILKKLNNPELTCQNSGGVRSIHNLLNLPENLMEFLDRAVFYIPVFTVIFAAFYDGEDYLADNL